VKEVCGFDSRLSWSEDAFRVWRDSPRGQRALNSFDNGSESGPKVNGVNGTTTTASAPRTTNGAASAGSGTALLQQEAESGDEVVDEDDDPPNKMCTKRRCERHKAWAKLVLHDVRFEESKVMEQMRGLETEEREIRERAMLRFRADRAVSGEEGEEDVEGRRRRREGWVEVVEA
ncbi:hypothetical protein LTS18_000842, partial [Coniosporium uncinatum]